MGGGAEGEDAFVGVCGKRSRVEGREDWLGFVGMPFASDGNGGGRAHGSGVDLEVLPIAS